LSAEDDVYLQKMYNRRRPKIMLEGSVGWVQVPVSDTQPPTDIVVQALNPDSHPDSNLGLQHDSPSQHGPSEVVLDSSAFGVTPGFSADSLESSPQDVAAHSDVQSNTPDEASHAASAAADEHCSSADADSLQDVHFGRSEISNPGTQHPHNV
jgi:hypothetical protein